MLLLILVNYKLSNMTTIEPTSALSIVIPDEFVAKINQIRAMNDKAYPRWMPHINLIFPFCDQSKFDNVYAQLSAKLAGFKKFTIKLNKIGSFAQSDIMTIHVKPEDSTDLQKLFAKIDECLPSMTNSRFHEFHPHMTIAQTPTIGADKQIKQFQKWLGSGFTVNVDKICFLSRSKTDKNDQFVVVKEIVLA